MEQSESFSFQNLLKNSDSLRLKKTSPLRLLFTPSLKEDAYFYGDGEFEIALKRASPITPDVIKSYIKQRGTIIFLSEEDFDRINKHIQDELLLTTRSLSMGDPFKNGSKHASILTTQLENLYLNPLDDTLLTTHFQSSKNFSHFIYTNKNIQAGLYQKVKAYNYHFTLKQPLLSSILLLSFLQQSKIFGEKEIYNLFLTSYYKDFGMSFIPKEKYDIYPLSEEDQKIFSKHALFSRELLEGRVPLGRSYLNMIENHHFINNLIRAKAHKEQHALDLLTGFESVILSALDMLVALTSERPYRDSISTYEALELIKKAIMDNFPLEFKSLVLFIRNFFGSK